MVECPSQTRSHALYDGDQPVDGLKAYGEESLPKCAVLKQRMLQVASLGPFVMAKHR